MRFIPDLDSIIIEYRVENKDKLLEVLKKNVVGYSRHWRYNVWTKKLMKNPEMYQDAYYSGKLLPYNYQWINSPAKIIFLQNSLFDKQSFLQIKVQPSQSYLWSKVFHLIIIFVLFPSLFFSIISSFSSDDYMILLAVISLVVLFFVLVIVSVHLSNYSNHRTIIINTFEKMLKDQGIQLQKLNENREKFGLF